MFPRVNHIAIAVKDLPATLKFYEESFGLKVSPIKDMPSQGVRVASVAFKNLKLEFITPISQESPISNFLSRRGDGLHHIALETATLEKDAAEVRGKLIRTLTDSPTIGYDGRPIIFLHPKDTRGVLIELEQADLK